MSSLSVTAKKAQNVPKEKFGKSDPYCQIVYQGQKVKTKVIKDSAEPEWNETLTFDLAGRELGSADSIEVQLKDWERIGSDKLLGQATVAARDLISSGELELSLALQDSNGRPTQTTLDLKLNYQAPAKPQQNLAGGSGAGTGEEVDAGDGDEEIDEAELNVPVGATPEQIATAKKERRAKKRQRAKLSTNPIDFQVRVKVIGARQLEGSNVHPVCKVTLFGETKQTRVRRCTGSPEWNEVFYYSYNISPAEIVSEFLSFEVFNARRLRSDALIGSFKCESGLVYDKDNHCVLNKWLLLNDPEDTTSVRGYLKVSVAILGPGDDPPSFKKKKGEEESEDIESNMLMPAGVALCPSTFKIKVYHAEDLPRMDSNLMEGVKNFFRSGKKKQRDLNDPYLVASFAGKPVETKVMYETYTPEFNQEIQLGFKFPSVAENLTLRMFDWDRVSAHDCIASGFVGLSTCSRAGEDGFLPTFGPCYVPFYGSTREFSELGDDNDELNYGKGEGVAYRGRVLVHLTTQLDCSPDAPIKDANPDDVISVAKYMRRHKYMLHVAFLEASMIQNVDGPVEFEVSIGCYGNKLDDTVAPSASTTQPTNAVFDGCRYRFLPWENTKPCIVVESFWEDISWRLETVNMINEMADVMDEKFKTVITAQKANLDQQEIKGMLHEITDEMMVLLSKPLPTTSSGQNINELDKFMMGSRKAELLAMIDDMRKLKERNPEPDEMLIELQNFSATIRAQAVEPQASIPDIFIWELVGNKRRAYYRISAAEVMYSARGYSGKRCNKDMTIILKHPGKRAYKEWEIPAKLRLKIWMGKKKDEEVWHASQTDNIVVMAETYENQAALLGKWFTKGPAMTRPAWSDVTGSLKLKKEHFTPPPGWQWAGDWVVSPELSSMYDKDAGHSTFIEDVYELQTRIPATPWHHAKVYWTDAKNDVMRSKEEIELTEGWKWDNDWTVDMNRGVDDEGYEYCVESTIGGYGPVEKTYHLCRRRRWVRQRTMVADANTLKKKEQLNLASSEGWEFAPLFNMKFHSKEAKMDLVRRRRWHRKMGPIDPKDVHPCFFSFGADDSDDELSGSEAEDAARLGCLAAPRMFLESTEKHHFQMRAYIYQARGLPAADDNSRSDPYAAISFTTKSQLTETLMKTLSPMWDQTLIFDDITLFGTAENIASNPPEVVVEIFDKDLIGRDEFLCRCVCKPMVKVSSADSRPCVLQWHTLIGTKGECGEILASFELIAADITQSASLMDLTEDGGVEPTSTSLMMNGEDLPFAPPKRKDDLYIVPTGIRPIMRRTAVEILCWGVRNMKRYQLISITSPSIEFEVGGIVKQSSLIKNTRKNPNFPEALLFVDCMLPKEDYYMPPLNIRVRDHRAFGRKPTVGMHVLTTLEKYMNTSDMPDLPALTGGDQHVDGAGPSDAGDALIEMPEDPPTGEDAIKPDLEDVDWWCKFHSSIGEEDKALKYMQQGFDPLMVYEKPLEDMDDFGGFIDFCDTFEIFTGDDSDDEDQEVIGEFKGAFRVYPLPEDPNEELPARIFDKLPCPDPEECVVRVYVVQAYDLQPADPNGMADPYLEITLGKKKISLRDTYRPNTLNPVFGEMLEFKCMIPLQKDLKITVKDYDLLTSDDVIGETYIDLENRLLSKYRATCGIPRTYFQAGPNIWRDSQSPGQILESFCNRNKLPLPVYSGNAKVTVGSRTFTLNEFENGKEPSPFWGVPQERLACYVLNCLPLVKEHLETRTLRSKLQPAFDQGKLQCWVDIFPSSLGPPGPPVDISPRVPKKYVLRVVIWNTTEVVLDETNLMGEQMSDIYVKGWLPGTDKQKTDIHYRSLDGDGNFNWRFVFPFEYMPAEQLLINKKKEHFWSLDETEERLAPKFTIQIWDNDFISADDFLGSVELDLNALPKPTKTGKACKLTQLPEFNKQAKLVSLFEQKKLNGFWPVYQMVGGNPQLQGKVEMELEIVPDKEAEERPAAFGRDEPNMHPILEPPNRPATSFFFLSNPCKSCRYIIWRRYKWYIIGGLLLLLLIAILALFIYTFPTNFWNFVLPK